MTRVCVLDDNRNANSALYGAAWRAARAMGYSRIITYTLPEESGASLRAAGFRKVGMTEAKTAGWSVPSRPRERPEKYPDGQKVCATCGNLVRIGGTLIGCVAHDKLILPNYPPYFGQKPCPDWKP